MLKYNTLGKTGIKVSQICFGSLTVSPLGADLPEAEGAEVIAYALESGIKTEKRRKSLANHTCSRYNKKAV